MNVAASSQFSVTAGTCSSPPRRAVRDIAGPALRDIKDGAQRRLRRELTEAAGAGQLLLQYHPRLSLRSGEQTGAEAVMRWSHPRRGMLPAASLFALAEEAGLAPAIGGWSLRAACVDAACWRDGGVLSVPVLTQQFDDDALVHQIATALEASSLQPERLELRIGEDAALAVDADRLLLLAAIRDLGVGVALDDFGSGVASLANLKRLPLTALKLDRVLVRSVPSDPEDAAIARAVIETAHAMGLIVVADGLENETQRAFLSACGCDEGVGELFGQASVPGRAMSFAAG